MQKMAPPIVVLVLVTGAVPSGELASVALPEPLARVLTDYETAWQSRNASALAALFAEDGFVLSNGVPPVRGRAAIERHYAGQEGPLSLPAYAFATEGSTGYIIGGFARRKGEPDIGKFTLTLRRDSSGRWLIVSDMTTATRGRRRSEARRIDCCQAGVAS